MKLTSETIRRALLKQSSADQEKRDYLRTKMYRTRYQVLGLSVPVQRTYLKAHPYSDPNPKNFSYWLGLWKDSQCFEVMSLSLFYFQGVRTIEDLVKSKRTLLSLSQKVDNWAHSDILSCVLARIRDHSPEAVDPTFKKWNQSKKAWPQRLSMTSLFYYSSLRTNQPKFSLVKNFVDRHLLSPDYYVQKAVGWTLRESHNVYPEKTFNYLEKNILKLSSYAFSASTEKMGKVKKNKLKGLRKERTLQ